MLVANPKLPVQFGQGSDRARQEKPGKLNYGSTGVGNSLHLTMEMFKRMAGIDIQAIPYRGDGPVFSALIAGDVDVAIVPICDRDPPDRNRKNPRARGQQRLPLAAAARRADCGRGRAAGL